MLPKGTGRGQCFHARGHSFSPYGPTLSRQITCLFFSCSKFFLQLITNGFVYATLSLNRLARHLLTICKNIFGFVKNLQNERVTQYQYLLYVSCIYQGSYGSWKTWKVLEFYSGIFQDWKVLDKGHWSWKVLEICLTQQKIKKCMEGNKENSVTVHVRRIAHAVQRNVERC